MLHTVKEVFKSPPQSISDTISDINEVHSCGISARVAQIHQLKERFKSGEEKKAIEYMCTEANDLEDIKQQMVKLAQSSHESIYEVEKVIDFIFKWILMRLIKNKQEIDTYFADSLSNDHCRTTFTESENVSLVKENSEDHLIINHVEVDNDYDNSKIFSGGEEHSNSDRLVGLHPNGWIDNCNYSEANNKQHLQGIAKSHQTNITENPVNNQICKSTNDEDKFESELVQKENIDHASISAVNTENTTIEGNSDLEHEKKLVDDEYCDMPFRLEGISIPAGDFPVIKEEQNLEDKHDFNLKTDQQKSLTCTECGKTLYSLQNLNDHIKLHRGISDQQCPHCTKSYVTAAGLRNHISYNHKEKQVHKCNQCTYVTKKKSHLKYHTQNTHSKERFICKFENCDTSFKSIIVRDRHEKRHSGAEKFQCAVCAKLLTSKTVLKEHMKRHMGQKDHQCSECGKTFVNPATARACKHSKTKERTPYLNTNMQKQMHTDGRYLKCSAENCDKSFRIRYDLQKHEKTHSGIKEFQCNQCNKFLTTKTVLEAHMKRHRGQKDFQCSVCGKTFVEPADARRCKHSKIKETS